MMKSAHTWSSLELLLDPLSCCLKFLQLSVTSSWLQGFVSGPEHKGKKSVLILFINERLVECSSLKRGLEATYAAIYPRTYSPFIFLVRCALLGVFERPFLSHDRHNCK